jgi:hypothetical protein
MRYLLSVDRSLRRVSLKKISVRAKNARNRARLRSAKQDGARETTGSWNAWVTNAWPSLRAAAPALIAIVAGATLIGAPGLIQRSDSSANSASPATSASQETPAPEQPLDTAKAAIAVVPAAPTARTRTPDTSAVSTHVVESPRATAVQTPQHADATSHTAAIAHAKPTPPADSTPDAEPTSPAERLASADAVNEGIVTISGCLQGNDDSFWLKDTSGANAPTARSWKSGFLKKHGDSVHVVDATRALRLSNYVSHRVIATGTLTNRTMQARSVEPIGASCH